MSAHSAYRQTAAVYESPFEALARQALRAAIVRYGWDHPVVASAQRSLMAIRRPGAL